MVNFLYISLVYQKWLADLRNKPYTTSINRYAIFKNDKFGLGDTIKNIGGYSMKRLILFIIILVAIYSNILCDDITYIVTQDSHLDHPVRMYTPVATLSENEIVYYSGKMGGPHDGNVITFPQHEPTILVKTNQGIEGFIDARHILLQNNSALPESITDVYWIYSFYQQVISRSEKDLLFNFEPFWLNEYRNYHIKENIPEELMLPWWKVIYPTTFIIRNTYISIRNIYSGDFINLIASNQQFNNNIITFNVICINKSNKHTQNQINRKFNENETYRVLFKIDGDYLDVFVNNDREKLTTLIGVDANFIIAIRDFFHENKNDFSRITWPRRADGTMDYPPPLNMSTYRRTHRVTDNLRLRDSANTSSLIVTTLLKDTEVQVIETGASTIINNITAPWVKIISSTGFTGWCFSGYLEEIAVNNSATVANSDTAENSLVSNKDAKVLPFWVWILIGAGVVVGVGVVVVVVIRKRK